MSGSAAVNRAGAGLQFSVDGEAPLTAPQTLSLANALCIRSALPPLSRGRRELNTSSRHGAMAERLRTRLTSPLRLRTRRFTAWRNRCSRCSPRHRQAGAWLPVFFRGTYRHRFRSLWFWRLLIGTWFSPWVDGYDGGHSIETAEIICTRRMSSRPLPPLPCPVLFDRRGGVPGGEQGVVFSFFAGARDRAAVGESDEIGGAGVNRETRWG